MGIYKHGITPSSQAAERRSPSPPHPNQYPRSYHESEKLYGFLNLLEERRFKMTKKNRAVMESIRDRLNTMLEG